MNLKTSILDPPRSFGAATKKRGEDRNVRLHKNIFLEKGCSRPTPTPTGDPIDGRGTRSRPQLPPYNSPTVATIVWLIRYFQPLGIIVTLLSHRVGNVASGHTRPILWVLSIAIETKKKTKHNRKLTVTVVGYRKLQF